MTATVSVLATALLESVDSALSSCVAGKPCYTILAPGQDVPWEFCDSCGGDQCGTAYVRMSRAYPSRNFPAQDGDATCTAPLSYEFRVGIARCVPVPADGMPPEPGDLMAVTLANYDDMMLLHCAIKDAFAENTYVLGEWTPLGPSGGCVGGEWRVMVTL